METALVTPSAAAASANPSKSSHAVVLNVGESTPVFEDRDYVVDGTELRVRLHATQRANLPEGGHAWGGSLMVCDGDDCRELSLSGPSKPPVEWDGFGFELLFVDPTSLRVSRGP